MADERGYALSNAHTTWDDDIYFNVDKLGFARAKKYQASVLKDHLKVGDQIYTEQNFVTDGETLTASVDSLDVALNSLTDTVSNLDFDQNGIKYAKVALTTTQVGGLGTAFELLSAAGAGKAYMLVGISCVIAPTTTLDVGSQNLELSFSGLSKYFSVIYNKDIETASKVIKNVPFGVSYDLDDNGAINIQLSDGVDPTSGSAAMTFHILYKTIDV